MRYTACARSTGVDLAAMLASSHSSIRMQGRHLCSHRFRSPHQMCFWQRAHVVCDMLQHSLKSHLKQAHKPLAAGTSMVAFLATLYYCWRAAAWALAMCGEWRATVGVLAVLWAGASMLNACRTLSPPQHRAPLQVRHKQGTTCTSSSASESAGSKGGKNMPIGGCAANPARGSRMAFWLLCSSCHTAQWRCRSCSCWRPAALWVGVRPPNACCMLLSPCCGRDSTPRI